MTSLRRPSAAPRPESQAIDTRRHPLPGNNAAQAKRDARKSRVGDKIKKRMSMRYAGGSEDLTPVIQPPMPSMPGQAAGPFGYGQYQYPYQGSQGDPGGGGGRMPVVEEDEDPYGGVRESIDFGAAGIGAGPSRRTPYDERIGGRGGDMRGVPPEQEWDLEELKQEGADVKAFVKKALMGADSDERRRFQAALQKEKQSTAKELQRNVFKNYAEFVTMSKEIATLETDMLELKELLGQWKDLPQLMGMEDSLAPTLDKDGKVQRRRTQRNSIADLQQLYKSQLTSLWSTVEGSQKYLPLLPGRHLVFETHHFVELNAATYKAKQSVSLFLLNDLLLIAGRRRTKNVGPVDDKERSRGRMVAERCWVLADLVVVDVKDSGDLTNALKIRRGKENCVYRTAKLEDKKALLSAFRQVSQELSEKKRKESEKEQQKRKTLWQGADGMSATPMSPNMSLLSPGRPQSSLGMTVSDSKDLRWIDDFGDELTMAIAMRDWDEAVQQVEKGESLMGIAAPNPTAKEMLTSRLEHLKTHLTSQLIHDLSSLETRKSSVVHLVNLLSRIDAADAAKEAFLKARTEVMMKRVRAIRCEGDTSIYINELAIVCFTIIRHTGDWYMTAFHEVAMASGFVSWAKRQIETFAEMFRRQVYIPTVNPETVEECIKVTASNNRKLLRDVGLDFTFLLSSLLGPDPNAAPLDPHLSFTQPTPAPAPHGSSVPGLGSGAGVGAGSTPFPPSRSEDTPTPDLLDILEKEFEDTPLTGSTAPLSINPKTARRPRLVSDNASAGSGGSSQQRVPSLKSPVSVPPESPAPPPRSARRTPVAAPPPPPRRGSSKSQEQDLHEEEEDSLR